MFKNLENYHIVLGSKSPRRAELLKGIGIPFTVAAIDNIDEHYPETMSKEQIPLYIAQKKAEAYKATMQEDTLLITADTVVHINGKILGKPADKTEAMAMLRLLSGKDHDVFTGVTLTSLHKQRSFSVGTKVSFAHLNREEIEYYVDTYKPFDKAGAYGVQEWIGYIAVRSIKGSYFNVMGLPLQRLYKELIRF